MERINNIWGYSAWGKPYFIVIGSSGKQYMMDAYDIYCILMDKIIIRTKKARIHEHITEVRQ